MIIVAWVAAFVHSLRQYFKTAGDESADYAAKVTAEAKVSDVDDDKAPASA